MAPKSGPGGSQSRPRGPEAKTKKEGKKKGKKKKKTKRRKNSCKSGSLCPAGFNKEECSLYLDLAVALLWPSSGPPKKKNKFMMKLFYFIRTNNSRYITY